MTLASMPDGYRAAVFGARGGIGSALVSLLESDPRCAAIHAGARTPPEAASPRTHPFAFDLTAEATIEQAAAGTAADGPLHLVIVATGLLHADGVKPEKSWRALDPAAMQTLYAVNALGPALIAKHTLPQLEKSGKAVFAALSARVGSIGDNRLGGWHGYRASKAALNMLIRTFAVELARTHPEAACIALHPGTVDTPLSRPFQSGVPEGRLFTPDQSATRMLGAIDTVTSRQSGRQLAWDGEEIPF